jgi:hypothetical protein
MKAILPSTALALTFAIFANALLLSGLIRYGNDTGHWDLPYRSLASALLSQGDLALWYPAAGNGFPQINMQYISWVINPMGIIVSLFRPYDYLSLAIENTLWRIVGFAGAFLFARQWTNGTLGATAIAATYVGSGVMSWAALSYSSFIGQMFAPWVLASGSLAIRASSIHDLMRSAGVFGLAYGLMVWCGYPGAWISAPVISGPVIFFLALATRSGIARLFSAFTLGLFLIILIISLIFSETISIYSINSSIIYSRVSPGMREGLLRGIDVAGLLLPNPSYLPGISSALLHPLYSGIMPIIFLTSMFGSFRRHSKLVIVITVSILGLAISNLQNWTLWDHPMFRELPALKSVSSISENYTLIIAFALPLGLSGMTWGKHLKLTRIDAVMLGGMAWVLVVSGDNPIADFLRFNIPPFVMVRYNHLYFWLVTLLATTLAWRQIERMTGATTVDDHVPSSVKEWGRRLACMGLAALLVSALVAIATPDAYGLGAPSAGSSAMGSPHLAWQATILFVSLLTGLTALRNSKQSGPTIETRTWVTPLVVTLIAFLGACLAGVLIRRAGVHPQPLIVPFSWQLAIDLTHGAFIVLLTALLFVRARSQTALRTGIAAVMVLDVSLAIPRYFSDNDTAGASELSWPYPPLQVGHGGDWFHPKSLGTVKSDFEAPFSSAVSPPPAVTRLRTDWGTLYDTWIHFPSSWSPISVADVLVARENLADGAPPVGCIAAQQAAPGKPAGSVRLLLATKVDVQFTADCDRLLVFTDSWAPGWSATIDGVPAPVLRVNNAIRGVMVPAGEHALQWRYRPRFLAPLLALLAAGLGIAGILIAAPLWSRRFPIPMSHRLDRLFGFDAPPPDEVRGSLLAPLVPVTPLPAAARGSRGLHSRDGNGSVALLRYSLPIAVPLTALAVLVLISVATYDPRIDGPTQGFRLFLFRSVLAGLWAWIVIAGRTGFRSPVGPSLMLLLLLPPLALQMARHTDRVSNGMPVASITTDFRSPSWQGPWEVTRRGNATSGTGPSGTVLRNDGATATAVTSSAQSINPDIWPWWKRPLGRIRSGPLDLTWTAILDRSGPYYTVATVGRLTIQALKGGYLVTAPVPGGDVRGDFVEVPATGQPKTVRWLLHIDPDTGATLSLDDRQVWKGGHPGVIERIILGDASNDAEHLGSITITDASIVQRVSLSAQ